MLIVLRDLLAVKPDLRVIVMSATIQVCAALAVQTLWDVLVGRLQRAQQVLIGSLGRKLLQLLQQRRMLRVGEP